MPLTVCISIALCALAFFVVLVGWWTRKSASDSAPKGIGWQFIRYIAVGTSLPIVGILALNDSLTGEVAAIISGVLGYSFGKKEDGPEK